MGRREEGSKREDSSLSVGSSRCHPDVSFSRTLAVGFAEISQKGVV